MKEHYESMSNEEYHSKDAISNTDLGLINRSIAHYEYTKLNGIEESEDLLVGRMFHEAVLEPELYKENYVMAPALDRRTKKGKEEYADFEEQSLGKTIVKEKHVIKVESMRDTIMESALVRAFIKKSKIEESYFWKDEETGIVCRCRPDMYVEELGILVDLKSTPDCSYNAFRRAMTKWSYDRQASHYMSGVGSVTGKKLQAFLFLAVEKTPPYDFNIFKIDEASLEVGDKLVRRSLNRLKKYCDNDMKPEPKEIQDISLAAYGFDVESR